MTTVVDIEGLYELIKNTPSPDCVYVDHATILSAIESIKIESEIRELILAAGVPDTYEFDLTVDLVKATLAELTSVRATVVRLRAREQELQDQLP